MSGRHRMRSLVLSFALLSASGFDVQVWAQNADDAVDQTAMAIPRIGMPGARSIALPQPLSPGEVARIRQILVQQRNGAITEANKGMDRLDSELLRGAILADRYLGTGYLPTSAELSVWLARFGDQPDAPAIRALLEMLPEPTPSRAKPASQPAAAFQVRAKPNPAQPSRRTRRVTPRTLLAQNDDQGCDRCRVSPMLAGSPAALNGGPGPSPVGLLYGANTTRSPPKLLFESSVATAPTRHRSALRPAHSGPPGWPSTVPMIAAAGSFGCAAPHEKLVRSMPRLLGMP